MRAARSIRRVIGGTGDFFNLPGERRFMLAPAISFTVARFGD
jgi:hypothetical protein